MPPAKNSALQLAMKLGRFKSRTSVQEELLATLQSSSMVDMSLWVVLPISQPQTAQMAKSYGKLMVLKREPYPAGAPANSSQPRNLLSLGSLIYFQANSGAGFTLFKTDGTNAGTVLVKDINPTGHGNVRDFLLFDGLIYFRATDGVNGTELWKTDGTEPWITDGTETGTHMLKDCNVGAGSCMSVIP